MSLEPDWAAKVLAVIDVCVELQSPGSLAVAITEDHELLIAPAGAEIMGGPHDGESVFPFLSLEVSRLAEVFDSAPAIVWHTHDVPSIGFEGTIDGAEAIVMVFSEPFPDDEHRYRIYQDGAFGEG